MEKASYTLECDTEETAMALCMQIEVAILAITRCREIRVKDESMTAEAEESLMQINERLSNEVHNMRERERGVEAKLRKQMASFVELRSQQWENDYTRVKQGLTVDPRTLNVLQKQGGVTEAEEQEGYNSSDDDKEMAEKEKTLERHDFDMKLDLKRGADEFSGDSGGSSSADKQELIARILDTLLLKFEALEEVLGLFTRDRMVTDAEREAEAATEKNEGEGGGDEAMEEREESESGAAESKDPDDVDQADQFWEVIQRVRGAIQVLGGKMSELDERFWGCRMGATGHYGAELGFEGSYGGMTASEMAEETARIQEQIAEETKQVERLVKEQDELQEVTDNSLRNLQNVGKVAHQLHKR